LTWTGATDNNWDTTSSNWNPNVAYKDQYGSTLIGDIVRFDDSIGAGPTNINLTTALQPATLTVDNSAVDYTFSGPGKLTRTMALTKSGSGVLKLQTANDYSGGSTLNGGLVQIGQNDALGSGAVNLNGSSVACDSTSPHSLSNSFSVTADTVFGNTTNIGTLTLGGSVDFLDASRLLRLDSDVVITGTMGNGIFNKDGLGTLTIKGAARFTKVDHNTYNGTVIFDGGLVTNNLFGWRLVC
jgi:autotransporter-associated beta strand protein